MATASIKLLLAGSLLVLTLNAQAESTLRVCVYPTTHISPLALERAKSTTSQMFATIGIALDWRSSSSPACRGFQQTRTVMLDFSTDMPLGQKPGALAYARPYEGVHITIMFDRVQELAREPGRVSILLGHVMTHEIAHLLQGISRHSQSGVMKASWDSKDIVQMTKDPLPFAPEDVRLIQEGWRSVALSAPSGALAGSH